MHFDFLPKVEHNKDAIREYERAENRYISRRIKILLPIAAFMLLIVWLLTR